MPILFQKAHGIIDVYKLVRADRYVLKEQCVRVILNVWCVTLWIILLCIQSIKLNTAEVESNNPTQFQTCTLRLNALLLGVWQMIDGSMVMVTAKKACEGFCD